jgi:hypothetical protein
LSLFGSGLSGLGSRLINSLDLSARSGRLSLVRDVVQRFLEPLARRETWQGLGDVAGGDSLF